MDQRMKTRMAVLAVAGLAVIGVLWCCNEDPPRRGGGNLDGSGSSGTPEAAGPRKVVMGKPAMLGQASPPIVVFTVKIEEPEIRVKLTGEEASVPAIDRSKYRGRVEVMQLANGKYVAVNSLPLETYLQGVVAKELLPSWHPAAYRAQAIAARTFAMFEMMTAGRGKAWDVNADQSSQVYGGIAAENATARAAVTETRGVMLTTTVAGQTGIFCARYSSCIGGAAQDPYEAWGDPSVPALTARLTGNVDSNSARFNWDRDFVVTREEVTRCVQNWGVRNNFAHLQTLGTVVSVVISKRNAATRRPTELLLTDSAGRSAPIRAEEFRLALMNDPAGKAPRPYSSYCEIRQEGNNFVLYEGHGFGHGIGMSQYGAQNMALQGYSHAQILAFFYPGAGLQKMW
jgi:stage II sporulation protein D